MRADCADATLPAFAALDDLPAKDLLGITERLLLTICRLAPATRRTGRIRLVRRRPGRLAGYGCVVAVGGAEVGDPGSRHPCARYNHSHILRPSAR
jgi:hypothetical protein